MLYLLLISIWPLINYLSLNYFGMSGYHEILILLFILVSAAIALWLIAKKLLKISIDRLIPPIFITTVLFFLYSNIVDNIIGPYNPLPFIKATYIYLAIFIPSVYITWKISTNTTTQKIFKVLIWTVFSLSVINFIIKFRAISSSNNETTPVFQFKHKPNVYYILIDAYARQDTLKEIANYNNEPFLKQLAENGFIVSKEAFSNYGSTTSSVSATMNMAYHKEREDSPSGKKLMLKSLKGINVTREIFRQNGYYIVNIPAHWHKGSCYGQEDLCIAKHQSIEVYQTFLKTTPLKIIELPINYVNLEEIKNIYKIEPQKPKFFFIHLAQVHDAIFDENGNKLPTIRGKQIAKDVTIGISRHTSTIKHMNPKVLNFIKFIREKDPNAIIIIQSDHGPALTRCLGKLNYRYIFGVFSAIYLPKYNNDNYKKIKNYLGGQYTLVNTFRYIFAYLSEKNPDLLPEKSFFLRKINKKLRELNIIDYNSKGK